MNDPYNPHERHLDRIDDAEQMRRMNEEQLRQQRERLRQQEEERQRRFQEQQRQTYRP